MIKWKNDALDRDNHKCVICNSKKRIHIHHIDESRKLGKNINNDLSNLMCLCFSCHLKIHHRVPAFPYKRKIIKLRRMGYSLLGIAMLLDLTKGGVFDVLHKAEKKDKGIWDDYLSHMFNAVYPIRKLGY